MVVVDGLGAAAPAAAAAAAAVAAVVAADGADAAAAAAGWPSNLDCQLADPAAAAAADEMR